MVARKGVGRVPLEPADTQSAELISEALVGARDTLPTPPHRNELLVDSSYHCEAIRLPGDLAGRPAHQVLELL